MPFCWEYNQIRLSGKAAHGLRLFWHVTRTAQRAWRCSAHGLQAGPLQQPLGPQQSFVPVSHGLSSSQRNSHPSQTDLGKPLQMDVEMLSQQFQTTSLPSNISDLSVSPRSVPATCHTCKNPCLLSGVLSVLLSCALQGARHMGRVMLLVHASNGIGTECKPGCVCMDMVVPLSRLLASAPNCEV
jgi:hypothetical protein